MSQPFDLTETPLEPGTTLIEASAGTGKTYCLTGIVVRMLVEGQAARPDQILVMTFTNAATQELVERIRSQIREAVRVFSTPDSGPPEPAPYLVSLAKRYGERGRESLERALLDLDTMEICTIHGFCRRVLEQHAFECGIAFDAEYTSDDTDMIEAAVEDFWRKALYSADPLLAAVVSHARWSPESLAKEFKEWRRHLDPKLRPAPLPLEQALERLRAAREALKAGWDRSVAEAALAKVSFTAESKRSVEQLPGEIDAVDAFCRTDQPEHLGSVIDMATETLVGSVYKKNQKDVRALAFPPLCDAVASATRDVELALRGAFLTETETILGQAKRRAGVQAYDDLVNGLHQALRDSRRGPALVAALSSRFSGILIDEFQDTDSRQYEIFKRLFGDRHLFFIGDPKQAIYRFRGADVLAYMRAKAEAGRSYVLGTNHRSVAPLVEGVNAVFATAPRPFVYREIPFEPVSAARSPTAAELAGDDGSALRWLWIGEPDSKKEAGPRTEAAIVAEIVRLLGTSATYEGRPLSPGDLAVLVRWNSHATSLQLALRSAGVRCVIGQESSIFESDEIAEIHALTTAIVRSSDEEAVRAALATRLWGETAGRIAELDLEVWQRLTAELGELHARWRRRGFVAMAHAFLASHDVRARLLAGPAGARRLTNVLHAIDVIHQASVELHLSPETAVAWLARMRRHWKQLDREALELRLESDDDAVQILTVHKSKGLEYPVTFCSHLWDVREEHDKVPLLVQLPAGPVYDCDVESRPVEITNAAEDEAISENARLAYVAMTRARERCYVVWGDVKSKKDAIASPLAYVLGQPAGATPSQSATEAMQAAIDNSSAWRARLDALADSHAGAIAVEDAAQTRAARLDPPPVDRSDLSARDFDPATHEQLRHWRVTSFSELAGERGAATSPVVATAAQPELPDHADPATEAMDVTGRAAATGMFAFARGPRAGICFHEILERVDFTRIETEETQAIVRAGLERHGFLHGWQHGNADFDPLAATLSMLERLTKSPLPGCGLRLEQVDRAHRLSEWQFYTPVSGLSARLVAQVLGRHGTGPVASQYAPALQARSGTLTHGFLNGFVDLVFAHEGRWYLVDWKSNHLGARPADYDRETLWHAMCADDYVLQYHLYTLGLHRYLRHRLSGYDYSRDFGGVYYGFLRGVEPPTERGWYFDRPPPELVDALDTAIGRESAP